MPVKPLRIVFVNHCHPDKGHVCALRLTRFAHALARLGHGVVLLTETLHRDDPGHRADTLRADLAAHDWSRPFFLACAPGPAPLLLLAREGQLPWGVRQAVLASGYLVRSGVFGDWLQGSRPYLTGLAESFKPDVVWATFGNTDAWNISRELAARAGCPWVADFKDNWEALIPPGFRRLLAARYADATHMTVFSKTHDRVAARWFGGVRTVLYSGFDMFEPSQDKLAGDYRVLVTGSIYDEQAFTNLIDGFGAWTERRRSGGEVGKPTLQYAGNDSQRVRRLAAPLEDSCVLDIRQFLPLYELRAMQHGADVNVYVRNPRSLFHHKVLELLSAGRPILCLPGEGDEALNIAAEIGVTLHSCATAQDVTKALEAIVTGSPTRLDAQRLNRYSWMEQAYVLESILAEQRKN